MKDTDNSKDDSNILRLKLSNFMGVCFQSMWVLLFYKNMVHLRTETLSGKKKEIDHEVLS